MITKDIYEVVKAYFENHSIDEQIDFLRKASFGKDTLDLRNGFLGELSCDFNGNYIYNEPPAVFPLEEVNQMLNSLNESELKFLVLKSSGEEYLYGGPYDSKQPDSGLREYIRHQIEKFPHNFEVLLNELNDFRSLGLESKWGQFEWNNRFLTCQQIVEINKGYEDKIDQSCMKIISDYRLEPEQISVLRQLAENNVDSKQLQIYSDGLKCNKILLKEIKDSYMELFSREGRSSSKQRGKSIKEMKKEAVDQLNKIQKKTASKKIDRHKNIAK